MDFLDHYYCVLYVRMIKYYCRAEKRLSFFTAPLPKKRKVNSCQKKGSVTIAPALQPQPETITLEQYETLPDDRRAEVFDGVVYDMSSLTLWLSATRTNWTESAATAPDFIIEIVSPANLSDDYIRKLYYYKNAAVREYWIVDPRGKTVTVNYFEGNIVTVQYPFDSTIKVNIHDDLYINFSNIAKLLNI